MTIIVQLSVARAKDAATSTPQGPANIPRQPVERATYLEPARHSVADPDAPRPLPPAKRDSLSEKSDTPRTLGAIVSVAGSLAVVLGLFFLLTWLMRRGMPSSAARLPDEVATVLGKAPLAGRQMHVLRFGNKLLLVCAGASGLDKLAEITEPDEVQRLVSLCGQTKSSGTTAAASQIFSRFTRRFSDQRPAAGTSSDLGIHSESAAAEEAANA